MFNWLERQEGFPHAHGDSLGTFAIRSKPEHFQVYEIPPCAPDGEGEHLWVKVRKTSCNTDWVATQLAEIAGIERACVSYAGRKDRHAICEQWFSLHIPGKETPEIVSDSDEFVVLESARHSRKLRTGGLKGNRFVITAISEEPIDWPAIQARMKVISEKGVPNYFGEQRFGNGGANLDATKRWAEGGKLTRDKNRRSMIISAGRSWIFNLLLAQKVQQNTWSIIAVGDYCVIDGRHSGFINDETDSSLTDRCVKGELHPSLPLVGEGTDIPSVLAKLSETEQSYLLQWCQKLRSVRMDEQARQTRFFPDQLEVEKISDTSFLVSFILPPGAFATTLFREVGKLTQRRQ